MKYLRRLSAGAFFLAAFAVSLRAETASSGLQSAPADSAVLRATIDAQMQNLTDTLLSDLKNPTAVTRGQVEQELSQLSSFMERFQNQGGPQAFELSERWSALRQSVTSVLEESRREMRGHAQLARLRQQAKGAVIALSLNQKAAELPQPPSLILLNSMAEEQQRVQAAEQAKTESLQKFMTDWELMVRTLSQAPETITPEPRFVAARTPTPEGSNAPGPMASLVMSIGGIALLIFVGVAEFLRKKFIKPVLALIRSADAAATGDLSRRDTEAPVGLLNHLETALNRLIGVLARSENRVYHLSTLVDSADEAIVSQALDGTILSWNKGAQRLYGYSVEEVKGKPITLLTARDGEKLLALIEAAKRGEKVPAVEMAQQGRNGRVARAVVRVAAIFDSTKNIIGTSLWAQNLAEFESPAPRRRPTSSVDEEAPLF
jgi:PAS domain S-box-containing protein